jgi:hypothetical protein
MLLKFDQHGVVLRPVSLQYSRLIALAGFVGVSRYLERLRARPAFQASLPEGSTGPIAWLPDTGP